MGENALHTYPQFFNRQLHKKCCNNHVDRVKRIWYLSPMRATKVQASLRIRAVSPEPSRLAHTSGESWGTFRQKARSLAPLNGWACAVKICHDGMLEDTNLLDGAHIMLILISDLQVFAPVNFAFTKHVYKIRTFLVTFSQLHTEKYVMCLELIETQLEIIFAYVLPTLTDQLKI